MWSTGFPYVVDCKWVHVLSRWARAEAFMAHQLTNSARPTWHLRLSFSQFQFLSSEFRPKSRRKLALSERFQSLGRHCRLLSVLGKVRSFPCSLLARCSFPPAHSVAGCIRGRFLVPSGAEQSVTIVYLSDAVNQGPKSCRESGTTARGLSATLGNSVLRIRLCFPSSIEASPRASAVRRRPRVHDSNHLQLLHINP
jgi:hypothetical protein